MTKGSQSPEIDLEYDMENVSSNPTIPERNLIAAVLARAISDVLNDYQSQQGVNDKYAATAWLKLDRLFTKKDFERDSKKRFTFVWCCLHLELDPYVMIEKITHWKENGIRIEF